MKKIAFAALVLTTAFVSNAFAESRNDCTAEPQAKWQSTDAMKAKGQQMGYDVRRVKVEGSCYEMYGIDSQGKKREVLFNPVTLEPAGEETNG